MLRKGTKSFYDWCIENSKEEYLDLWDYDLNKKTPKDIECTVKDGYYFKCNKGIHESYLYRIRSITIDNSRGPQCPVCGSIYQWCIDNNRNDIIEAWDGEKNKIDMQHMSKSSSKKAWFKFKYYSYNYTIAYISSKKKTDPVNKYKNSLGYYIVEHFGYEYIDKIWSDKNKLSPFEYDKGSGKKVWLKCIKKDYHEDYPIACYSFSAGSAVGCPMCASKIIHPLDSFAQFNINRYGADWIEKCWMEDNTLDPFTISVNNNSIKVHIRCLDVDYHDFWITPNNYDMRDKVCHYCNVKGTGGKVHPLDSFGAKFPQFVDLWSDKNSKTPYEYSVYSHNYVWLKCENGIHEDYKRKVSDLSRHPDRLCSKCSNVSSYEKQTRRYIESLNYKINYEQYCTLYPTNPLTNYKLPYDNEIEDLKLIIEVMGKQHYELTGLHILASQHSGKTPEEEFEYSKWKDAFKKQYALDNGYYYLELPYTAFKDETYIKLIDNKISQIINLESVETAGFDEKSSD